jgi:hypothetical protein
MGKTPQRARRWWADYGNGNLSKFKKAGKNIMKVLDQQVIAAHQNLQHLEQCLQKAQSDLQVAQAAVKSYTEQVAQAKQQIAKL